MHGNNDTMHRVAEIGSGDDDVLDPSEKNEVTDLLIEPSINAVVDDTATGASDGLTRPPLIISLRCSLWWLYCLHGGFSISLPSTALMYMMNSHLELPLSLIPTYGAVAFLPFSLKPLYAYWSSTNNHHGEHFPWNRNNQLSTLLALNAIWYLLLMRIPRRGVTWFLLLAFLRGVTTAWPELLLELSLIDQAWDYHDNNRDDDEKRRGGTVQKASIATEDDTADDDDERNANNNISPSNHLLTHSKDQQGYETTAAQLQSQAATARNIGSVVAYVVVLIIFIEQQYISRPYQQHQQQGLKLSLEIASLLFFLSFITGLVCAILAYMFLSKPRKRQHQGRLPCPPTLAEDNETGIALANAAANTVPHSTYASYQRMYDSDSENDNNLTQISSSSSRGCCYLRRLCPRRETVLVIALQAAVILMIVRQPLVQRGAESRGFSEMIYSIGLWLWYGSMTVCLLVMVAALTKDHFSVKDQDEQDELTTLNNHNNHNGWTPRDYKVAFFLLLRRTVPNASMLVESYRYSILAMRSPIAWHLLSLWDMVVLTLASWSFGRIWATYCQEGKITFLYTITTILAALASLSHLWFIHVSSQQANYGHEDNNNNQDNTPLSLFGFGVAMVTSTLSTWLSEWSFLPDVMLATVRLKQKQKNSCLNTVIVHDDSDLLQQGGQEQQPQQQLDMSNDHVSSRQRGVRYGSFVACIDLGDQWGGLLAGFLVGLMGITRENQWEHLDHYISLCAILGLTSLVFLFLLR